MQQLQARWYQEQCVKLNIDYFNGKSKKNYINILPTGSGKSVIIALTTAGLNGNTVVFQPSLEILQQNYLKFIHHGFRASIYSASANSKRIDKVTFATIGSVASKPHLFKSFDNIIIDECHLVNPKGGMYANFIDEISHAKVLGLTATPYRLVSGHDGAELRFITRTSPRIFNDVLYYVQNDVLFNEGHLAKLEYYKFDIINRQMLSMNKSGTDFTDQSIRSYYRKIDMPKITAEYANRLLKKRKNLLVFCTLISEAERVASMVDGSVVVTGETDKNLRERILVKFKKGEIKCVINVGVLTTGFDYPELECVLIARSTMSLALYYQMAGRGFRPHPFKESCWIVDLGGNYDFFGKFETMKVEQTEKGLYYISNNGRQLTNVTFTKK